MTIAAEIFRYAQNDGIGAGIDGKNKKSAEIKRRICVVNKYRERHSYMRSRICSRSQRVGATDRTYASRVGAKWNRPSPHAS
ncbi:MAG: hypothetical protein IJ566_05680 [Cardiobacteriaceae bacterium]|nr:hypothetical protein [Cardiobacteriaceae bacterium]